MDDRWGDDPELDEIIDEAVAALLAIGEAVPSEVLWEMLELGADRDAFVQRLESDSRVRQTDGGWVELRSSGVIHRARPGTRRSGRNIMDEFFDILDAHGEPMDFSYLTDSLAHSLTEQKLKSRLSADKRFMRTDRSAYGLTEWGLEPYDGLINLMKRSIERQGGEAAIDDIIGDLASRFTFKEQSVRTFAGTDEFIASGRGRIRVRQAHERVEEQDHPTSASRDCVRIGTRWALRVTIDDRLLSGFSVDLPPGFGRALGVSRGEYARVTTDDGTFIGVSRKALNDSLGRLRPVAEAMGLEPGDVLLVMAPEDPTGTVSFRAVRFEELAEMKADERVAALLGIDGALDTATVARALDMPTRSSAAALAATLRLRGEEALADELASVLDEDGTHSAVDAADIAEALGF